MFTNLKLGIQDIFKNKGLFIASSFFLFIFSFVIIMTVITVYNAHDEISFINSSSTTKQFDVILSGYSLDVNRQTQENLTMIYEENAFSTIFSPTLSQENNQQIFLILGDADMIHSEFTLRDDISAYATTDKTTIIIDNKDVAINIVENDRFNVDTINYFGETNEDSIFVVYKGEALENLLNQFALNSFSDYYEIIYNTQILQSDVERIESFEHLISEEIDSLSIRDSYLYRTYSELDFLSHFMISLIILLLISGIFSFVMIIQGMLQKSKRDLTIHLQSGATIQQVSIRFIVFFGSILVFAYTLLVLLKFIDSFTGPVIHLFFITIAIILISYILIALYRSDLVNNLRGDTQS